MKNYEIRDISVQDLQNNIANNEKEIKRLEFSHSVSSIENPLQIRTTRRLLARLKTELRQRTSKQLEQVFKNDNDKLSYREMIKNNKLYTPINFSKLKKERKMFLKHKDI